ncbi:MAG: hypothetical protein EOO38_26595 [Cytophagaceae bacterium]|nr:MAG: hypothetical protein EOO38_26595 [Cytophagaceae bacterium]
MPNSTIATEGRSKETCVVPRMTLGMSETVDAAALLESILSDTRDHWNSAFPTKSPNYETWIAKSSISKLLDDDVNEEWEAREAAEREVEAAYWEKLASERRAG